MSTTLTSIISELTSSLSVLYAKDCRLKSFHQYVLKRKFKLYWKLTFDNFSVSHPYLLKKITPDHMKLIYSLNGSLYFVTEFCVQNRFSIDIDVFSCSFTLFCSIQTSLKGFRGGAALRYVFFSFAVYPASHSIQQSYIYGTSSSSIKVYCIRFMGQQVT